MTWHDVDPAYVFHVANSFEDAEGRVVVDCCAYETMFDGAMPGPFGRNLGLERWTVDPAGGKVARETLSAAPQEFPRCDERHFTRPCRHVWTVGLPDDASPEYFASAPLYRHDLRTGRRWSGLSAPMQCPANSYSCPARPMPRRAKVGSWAS